MRKSVFSVLLAASVLAVSGLAMAGDVHTSRGLARPGDPEIVSITAPGDRLVITVDGDGDGDIDCALLDADGDLVVKDEGPRDGCRFAIPAHGYKYTLGIVNQGRVSSRYTARWLSQ